MNQTHDVYQQLHSTVSLAWDRLFVPSYKYTLLSFSLFGYCVLLCSVGAVYPISDNAW